MSDRGRDKKFRERNSLLYPSPLPGGDFFSAHVTRERQKARELRHSSWWKEKLDAGICYYCGRKVPPEELTMDHKIPLSQGGFTEKSNIAACCKNCNNMKKNLMPPEWEEYLRKAKEQENERKD